MRERCYALRHGVGLNNPSVLPLASHRLGGARETPPRSGNAPNNGAFPSSQVVKAPPRRGKAFWSAARFVCRMTLYACRSSSHKTRYASFVGTLKDKKAFARPPRRLKDRVPKKHFAKQKICGKRRRRRKWRGDDGRHPPHYAPCGDEATPSVCFANTSLLYRAPKKHFAKQKICGKRRRKPSGQAARNAAADLRALR